MPFNPEKFGQAKFEARKRKVRVDALASFFDDGEEPEWEVRGLDTNELHQAREAEKRRTDISNVIEAIAKGGDQAEGVRQALGLAKGTPGEIVRRLEMLVSGSVNPAIELPHAVKLAESFPIEFLMLTNAITELTAQGFDLVKPIAASQPTHH